jgi:CubicO group peptidase (beta-lactamase class C family)
MRLVSRGVEALRLVESWPARHAAVGVAGPNGVLASKGAGGRSFPWTSVTKLVTALATLVAAEEGTIDLDEPAGPPGSTVRHLLAHASGLPFAGAAAVAPPGARRIYSNAGIESLAEAIAVHAEMPFADYLSGAVLEPLGLAGELRVSAATGMHGSLDDLLALGGELLAPSLVAPETLAEATTVAFPGLSGVLPGFGHMDPNDWGLGFELRDGKAPHWTGERNSPRTFGHFGGSGTFLWVDRDAGVACACLTDLAFGDWAKAAWPRLADAVLAELAAR